MGLCKYVFAAFALLLYVDVVAGWTITLQYDRGEWRMRNCQLNAQVSSDCELDTYRWLLLSWAAPGFAAAASLMVFGVFYFICKYACNCCGGRKQSPNFCIPDSELPAKYGKADLIRPLFLSVVVFIMCIAACAWGLESATRFKGSVRSMSSALWTEVRALEDTGAASLRALKDASSVQKLNVTEHHAVGFYSQDEIMWDLNRSLAITFEAIDSIVANTVDQMYKYTQASICAVYAIFVLPTVASVVGIVFAFCNCRRYTSMMLVWFFCVVGVLVWGCNGLAVSTNFMVHQLCQEVEDFTFYQVNAMSAVAECNKTALETYARGYDKVLEQLAMETCGVLSPMCYSEANTASANVDAMRVLHCPSEISNSAAENFVPCHKVSPIQMHQWMTQYFYTSPALASAPTAEALSVSKGYTCTNPMLTGSRCTLSECATACLDPVSRTPSTVAEAARIALIQGGDLSRLLHIRDTRVMDLSSCTPVLSHLVPPLHGGCISLLGAADSLESSSGLLSLAIILALMTYILGAKRFIPLHEALLPQYDDWVRDGWEGGHHQGYGLHVSTSWATDRGYFF